MPININTKANIPSLTNTIMLNHFFCCGFGLLMGTIETRMYYYIVSLKKMEEKKCSLTNGNTNSSNYLLEPVLCENEMKKKTFEEHCVHHFIDNFSNKVIRLQKK